jgi:hypothetical protein
MGGPYQLGTGRSLRCESQLLSQQKSLPHPFSLSLSTPSLPPLLPPPLSTPSLPPLYSTPSLPLSLLYSLPPSPLSLLYSLPLSLLPSPLSLLPPFPHPLSCHLSPFFTPLLLPALPSPYLLPPYLFPSPFSLSSFTPLSLPLSPLSLPPFFTPLPIPLSFHPPSLFFFCSSPFFNPSFSLSAKLAQTSGYSTSQ